MGIRIRDIVPTNPFKSLAEGDMLQVVFLALMVGIALTVLPRERTRPLLELCETLTPPAGAVKLALRGSVDGTLDVPGERRLVRRALSNLISNALRHARSHVEVAVRRDGGQIHIEVDDDGPGVPPSDREHIFEPFWRREDGRDDAPARGFGLGLAIVRRIALRSGGRVEVSTAPTLGGARFQLSLAQWKPTATP